MEELVRRFFKFNLQFNNEIYSYERANIIIKSAIDYGFRLKNTDGSGKIAKGSALLYVVDYDNRIIFNIFIGKSNLPGKNRLGHISLSVEPYGNENTVKSQLEAQEIFRAIAQLKREFINCDFIADGSKYIAAIQYNQGIQRKIDELNERL